jgi:hypothetical protein
MMNLFEILQTLGILAGGLAAAYGEWNRRKIRAVHEQVNGQSAALVATTRALGVTEGVAQEAARNEAEASEA